MTDNVNEAKGDQGPESWKPPLGKQKFLSKCLGPLELILNLATPVSYHCTYAKMWVTVKYTYDLTITSDEKSALSGMLGLC